jgi:hypothetical protein
MNLLHDYSLNISRFKSDCENLPITITPKLHIVFHQIDQFIQEEKKSLGLYSEQATESVHHDFGNLWEERYKRHTSHPDYNTQLLNSVIEYNSKHV